MDKNRKKQKSIFDILVKKGKKGFFGGGIVGSAGGVVVGTALGGPVGGFIGSGLGAVGGASLGSGVEGTIKKRRK